jgi:hypothetical protein
VAASAQFLLKITLANDRHKKKVVVTFVVTID